MSEIKPSVTKELWLEKPEVAQHIMNSDSEDAAGWAATGWWVSGGIVATLVLNLAVKYGGGPFGSLLDLAIKASKTKRQASDETTQGPDHL